MQGNTHSIADIIVVVAFLVLYILFLQLSIAGELVK